jgi:hypothetical protein
LECGQHADPAAPEVGYRAIRNTLAHLRLIDADPPAARTDIELLCLSEVTDRLHPDDALARQWSSYDRVSRGELIGTRADGTQVLAPDDGFIVFPNSAAPAGNEWFYFARRCSRVLRPATS